MKAYKTVEKLGSAQFVERKSRFIGTISPAATEAAAMEFINRIKAENMQATHNCWAYLLRGNTAQRYSDDGEPHGTAGVPILEVLRKEELFDAAVVVTRYYGGIQLGAGGLIRAYSHGAKIAVDSGGRLIMAPCFAAKLTLPYQLYDRFLALTESYPMVTLETDYQTEITLTVRVREDYLEKLQTVLTELSSGTIVPEVLRKEFAPI